MMMMICTLSAVVQMALLMRLPWKEWTAILSDVSKQGGHGAAHFLRKRKLLGEGRTVKTPCDEIAMSQG